jgi:hypothetical protein
VAGPLAPHLRRRRVGLSSVWRSHACGGHHRGPRRDPEDSHPPRPPDRGAGAPATAVRPVRLELSPSAGAVFPALTPEVRPLAHARWAARQPGLTPPGRPLLAPGPPIMRSVVTEGRRAGRRAGQMAGRGERRIPALSPLSPDPSSWRGVPARASCETTAPGGHHMVRLGRLLYVTPTLRTYFARTQPMVATT